MLDAQLLQLQMPIKSTLPTGPRYRLIPWLLRGRRLPPGLWHQWNQEMIDLILPYPQVTIWYNPSFSGTPQALRKERMKWAPTTRIGELIVCCWPRSPEHWHLTQFIYQPDHQHYYNQCSECYIGTIDHEPDMVAMLEYLPRALTLWALQ